MAKKLMAAVLTLALINLLGSATSHVATTESKSAQFAERVKQNILKLGSGPEAIVEVKLRDKQRLKGYVAEAGEESFVVVNTTTGIPTTVEYAQVKQVKGHNLSSGAKIAIGVGIGIGVFLILALIFKDHINAY